MVAALLLACSRWARSTEAKTEGQSPNNAAMKSTVPVSGGWRVGEPVSFEKLTVFPVTSDEVASDDEFITLDEGLRAGTVTVSELGDDGRARPINMQGNARVQRRDGAQVNKLALTNRSGKKLVLIAGEMVVGGKQDRIVGHDCIIGSSETPVPIDVFCVEHGRWSGPASHATGGAKMMASPKVREKAQAKKDQSQVWGAVAESVSENKVATATGDLKSVYRDSRVVTTLDNYERAFKDRLKGTKIVGVVVAVGGKIISADVFASPRLFQAYWPKMLKSYALEAMNAGAAAKQAADLKAAEAFLARAEGSNASTGQSGVYRLNENQSEADASFELESASVASPSKLVHFNRVSKK
jgi:hypothetical protein